MSLGITACSGLFVHPLPSFFLPFFIVPIFLSSFLSSLRFVTSFLCHSLSVSFLIHLPLIDCLLEFIFSSLPLLFFLPTSFPPILYCWLSVDVNFRHPLPLSLIVYLPSVLPFFFSFFLSLSSFLNILAVDFRSVFVFVYLCLSLAICCCFTSCC